MKLKFLLIPAFAVVTLAAYTLTLSYTNTPSLIDQLEVLANGEAGENNGESGGDNNESGTGGANKVPDTSTQRLCKIYVEERVWTQLPNGTWDWVYIKTPTGQSEYRPVVKCVEGNSFCTPYEPC